MTVWEYFSSKVITLSFLAIGGLLIGAVLAAVGTAPALIGVLAVSYLLLLLCWLTVDFFVERGRIQKLEKLIEELPDKYLLGEVLPAPANLGERRYYRAVREISRSAVGVAEQAKREKEDYCDYVESWIHEIKTPLTACSLILSNSGDVRKLRRELRRADNLTESILYYARMRTAEKDLKIKKLSVAAVIEEAVRSQMELLIAAGISVETEGDFSVNSDGKSLEFILKQLLINCAKYCPGCRVQITARDGSIAVRDNGIGIPSHELRRVTERGFTGSNGRHLGSSTGMGLYIVRELCRQLEIVLEITSVQNEFTCITLCFQN